MFASTIREGEWVISPSGRVWVVLGFGTDDPPFKAMDRVLLADPYDMSNQVELAPKLLRHADGRRGGDLIINLLPNGIKTL